jgi:hypothetical protein
MSTPCKREGEFKTLFDDMKTIKKTLYEKDGLLTTMTTLSGNVSELTKQMGILTTSTNALVQFQTEVETERRVNDKLQEKKISRSRYVTPLVVVNLLTILGLVLTMILR